MRIAFVNHSRRKVGGAEVYLDSVIPAIARAGHQIAWLHEDNSEYVEREPISVPDGTPAWSTGSLGRQQALDKLKSWRPDICFAHGLHDTDLEAGVVALGRSALYLHNYYGTCVSGTKTHNTSSPTSCERQFGAACLAQYFPKHCGGSNPFTMWQLYRLQSRRLDLMRRYRVLIANSDHISRELARHDLKSERVYYPLVFPDEIQPSSRTFGSELRLVFAARMTSLKGGQYLLAALPEVHRRLQKKLHVTFAGDGPDRSAWEQTASSIRSEHINIEFPGWLGAAGLRNTLASADLLVYPSIWPEPFGLSGLEAGLYGVPSVAFNVGGIPEWLHDGVNGHLSIVGAQPLAEAIIRSLNDPQHYAELRAGACRRTREYTMEAHLAQLMPVLERCSG
jgi:glycosyltransferase involved in cell wall biosynthesis